MVQNHLALSWGKRVVRDGGGSAKIRGAYLVPRSGKISHVLAQSGLFRRAQPTALEQAGQGLDGMLMLPPQQDASAPARGSVPFTAKTVVHLSDGASLPLQGLILDSERHTIQYVLVGTRAKARAIPYGQVQKIASGSPSINLGRTDLEDLPVFRPDDEAQRNAVAALADSDPTGGGAFSAVHVHVRDGTAHLSGNVRVPIQKTEAEDAVRHANGILRVESALVTDWDLRINIAEVLAQEGLARRGLVQVRSSSGRVTLRGHLPSVEFIERAVALAAAVPGVQSVEHSIEVRLPAAKEPAPAVEAGLPAADAEEADEAESGSASTP